MANLKSVKKDIRKSRKRQLQNATQRTRLRTYDKKIRALVLEGKLDEAQTTFRLYAKYLDRAGKTNLIHHGQADRKKSRIALLIARGKKKKA